jgi:hypothetical protein
VAASFTGYGVVITATVRCNHISKSISPFTDF